MSTAPQKSPRSARMLAVDLLQQVHAVREDEEKVSQRNSGARGLRAYFAPIAHQRRAGLITLTAVHTRDVGQVRRLDPTQDSDFADLVASVRVHGVIQPVCVTWDEVNDCFWTDYGHRRVAAAKAAGLTSIPAIVSMQGEGGDMPQLLGAVLTQKQLIENLQRTQLPALDVSHALQRLIAEGLTAAAVSQALGKSKSWVSKHLKLLDLPKSILDRDDATALGHEILYTIAQSTADNTEREALLAIALEGGRPALNRALDLRRAVQEGTPLAQETAVLDLALEDAELSSVSEQPVAKEASAGPMPRRTQNTLQTAMSRAEKTVAHLHALVDVLPDPRLGDLRVQAQALLFAISQYQAVQDQ